MPSKQKSSTDIRASVRDIDIRLSVEDVERCIAPYVHARVSLDDPAWIRAEDKANRKLLALLRRERKFLGPARLLWSRVKQNRRLWDDHWARESRFSAGLYDRDWKADPYEWRDRGLFMTRAGGRGSRILFLMRAIEAARPRTVLEVGFGDGLNLITLANRFPDIEFKGIDLARTGADAARKLQSEARFPEHLRKFSPDPVRDADAYRRIEFFQGSAAELPFDAGSFDMVLTCVALEQMETIRSQVMRELHRVSNRWLATLEPFRDINDKGLRLAHVRRTNQIKLKIDDLRDYGWRNLFVSSDLPQKISLAALLVVARKLS